MSKSLLFVTLLGASILLQGTLATSSCEGVPNTEPLNTNEPKLVKTVENGYLMEVEGSKIKIAHVYGSPYQMGYAQGQLLKEEITSLYPQFFDWLAQDLYNGVPSWLPEWLVVDALKFVGPILLDLTYALESDYIPDYYLQEMQGVADATGLSFKSVRRIALVPELTQMDCSMLGSWGAASDKSGAGSVYQLRALDWDTDNPFGDYTLVLVYHPDQGHDFAVWTWTGFIGAVSGYSSVDFGMSEVGYDQDVKHKSRVGAPTTFVMRDILQFDVTREEAIRRIVNTKRTASVFLGLGTPKGFNIVLYNVEDPVVYGDKNYTIWGPIDPTFDDVIYLETHHNGCFPELIKEYYGAINAETIMKYFPSMEKTGTNHIAVYDMAKRYMYISTGYRDSSMNWIPAYSQGYLRLDMAAAFAMPHPSKTEN